MVQINLSGDTLTTFINKIIFRMKPSIIRKGLACFTSITNTPNQSFVRCIASLIEGEENRKVAGMGFGKGLLYSRRRQTKEQPGPSRLNHQNGLKRTDRNHQRFFGIRT